jgi:hypothetical protein
MPLAGLEPAIPATERPQTHTLDNAEIVFIDMYFKRVTELGFLPLIFDFCICILSIGFSIREAI